VDGRAGGTGRGIGEGGRGIEGGEIGSGGMSFLLILITTVVAILSPLML